MGGIINAKDALPVGHEPTKTSISWLIYGTGGRVILWKTMTKVTKDNSYLTVEEGNRMMEALDERGKLTIRLAQALAHFDRNVMLAIITSHMSFEDLKELVEFQERKN